MITKMWGIQSLITLITVVIAFVVLISGEKFLGTAVSFGAFIFIIGVGICLPSAVALRTANYWHKAVGRNVSPDHSPALFHFKVYGGLVVGFALMLAGLLNALSVIDLVSKL